VPRPSGRSRRPIENPFREIEHGSGLGHVRWVVERTLAWLHHFKRLLVRYDRRHEIHEAFLAIGCCLVCFREASALIAKSDPRGTASACTA
jgi:transposase